MQELIVYIVSLFTVLNPILSIANTKTTLLLTGDIMLARSVMEQSMGRNNPTYPFIKVADRLKSADIVFSNLETPIVSNCPKIDNQFKFCADPKMVIGLTFAGVDIVNLANNHTLNMGSSGLVETEKNLTENGIKWVGQGNLEVIEKNGIKFGFLGFDYVDNKLRDQDLELIKKSKEKVDLLVIGIHWGEEYKNIPSNLQKDIAQKIITSGADIIAGHHPHVVQKMELIDNKPVFYSLGNFVFDQMWSEETRRGVVGQLEFFGKKLESVQSVNIYLKNFAQPDWVN